MAKLRAPSCVIDAAAVACDDGGVPSFDLLAWKKRDGGVFLYAFDLIELDGEDLRSEPLVQRKLLLRRLLEGAGPGLVLNEWVEGKDVEGHAVFEHACSLGLEGIVSKQLAAPYRSGPSRDWIKVKNLDGPAMRRVQAATW